MPMDWLPGLNELQYGPDCLMSSQRSGYVRLAHCWQLSFQKMLPHTHQCVIHSLTHPSLRSSFKVLSKTFIRFIILEPTLSTTQTHLKANTSSLLPQAIHTSQTKKCHRQDWEVRCSISCLDCILTILTELEEVLVNFVQHCVTLEDEVKCTRRVL